MDLSINNHELETRIREEAEKQGVEPQELVLQVLLEHLSAGNGDRLDADESRLLSAINAGPSEAEWSRYHELIQRRQDEGLSETDLQELTDISDRIEALNARRVACLAELAARRGVSLPELMDQLGIKSPKVA